MNLTSGRVSRTPVRIGTSLPSPTRTVRASGMTFLHYTVAARAMQGTAGLRFADERASDSVCAGYDALLPLIRQRESLEPSSNRTR